MRYYHNMLFLGAFNRHDRPLLNFRNRDKYLEGSPDAYHSGSFLGVELLRLSLEEAISILGGLQQGGSATENASDLEAIRDIVRDIAVALTGSEVSFTQVSDQKSACIIPDPHTLLLKSYLSKAQQLFEMWPCPETARILDRWQKAQGTA